MVDTQSVCSRCIDHAAGFACASRCRSGMVLIYAVLVLPVLLALAVLTVDTGRLLLADSELQTAADLAARYAASGMISSSTRSTTAYNQAVAACGDLRADGRSISVTPSAITLGIWDTNTKTFTPVTDQSLANAVRVTLTQTLGGIGSPKMFAQGFGSSPPTVHAVSIAMASVAETEVVSPSQGNMWLAGMPDNSVSTNLQGNAGRYDNSGTSGNRKQRPEEVTLASLGLEEGDLVSFEGLSGVGSNGSGSSNTGPDGNQTWNVALGNSAPAMVPNNSVNGIANVRAPIAACMAVFLSDAAPNTTPAPAGLDFATLAQRDYATIEPLLKQPFFVGDGKNSWGEVQTIRVPAGATRIFTGMMDAWQWNDNTGSFRLKFYRSKTVTLVQ